MADDSEHSPVLFFINFVEGVYLFNLTVCSKYNARSSVVVNVTVLPGMYELVPCICFHTLCVCTYYYYSDVHEKNLVQLYLTDDDSNTLTLNKLVCMYVCVYVHMYVYNVCMCVYMYICMYIMYVCVCVCVHMYVYNVCMCVCMYVYASVVLYIGAYIVEYV